MFYGAVVWDPWLIVAQIVCLQCLFYLNLGVFLAILVGTRVSRMSLVYFFDYDAVTISTGWCVIASFTLSSLAGAGIMLYLIERAKKCLDFSATVYIVHLFICIIYGGWPSSITWWIVSGTGMALMALLGEYLCIRRELREIPITRFRSRSGGKDFNQYAAHAIDKLLEKRRRYLHAEHRKPHLFSDQPIYGSSGNARYQNNDQVGILWKAWGCHYPQRWWVVHSRCDPHFWSISPKHCLGFPMVEQN